MLYLQAPAAARVAAKGKGGIFHAARAGDLAAISDYLLVHAACVHDRDEFRTRHTPLPPPPPPPPPPPLPSFTEPQSELYASTCGVR